MVKRIFNLSNLTLLTALALSAIAAWYSILGLTAIFAAAVMPIIIMGGSLEVAKVVTTVWLHKYWDRISWQLKSYLVPAVMALAFLTSMGIFGFLSKAHMDQGVPSGDIAAKVALIDEKIKTQRENVEVSRKALSQMDAQVDQRLSRGDSEAGAERAVVNRKQQAKERASLQNDIAVAQKEIAKLNEERAPIASELRKVEAEVGPIKYIAALIYGDNPDQNVLERAVRWVIILIVFVFDPLALTLVIASNSSRRWQVEIWKKEDEEEAENIRDTIAKLKEEEAKLQEDKMATAFFGADVDAPTEIVPSVVEPKEEVVEVVEAKEPESLLDKHPYLFTPAGNPTPPGIEPVGPMVAPVDVVESIEPETTPTVEVAEEKVEEPVAPEVEESKAEPEPEPEVTVAEVAEEVKAEPVAPIRIETEGVTKERPYKDMEDGYVSFEGKMIKKAALKEIKPEFFMLHADDGTQPNSGFGTAFPKLANKGDTFVRVDMLPNKVYKFDGFKWIELVKEHSDSYLFNQEYLQYLIAKIDSGEYDVELLSDVEREQIEEYLRSQNT